MGIFFYVEKNKPLSIEKGFYLFQAQLLANKNFVSIFNMI